MTDAPKKVAIFVDGDNVSASRAERINQIAGTLGVITMKRSYFREVPRNAWSDVSGFDSHPVPPGKSEADFRLSFDAVQAFTEGKAETFVIASSDGDLGYVVRWLRSRGCTVVIMAAHHVSSDTAKCASEVIIMEPRDPMVKKQPQVDREPVSEELEILARGIITSCGGSVALQKFGTLMANHKMSAKAGGFRSWRQFFAHRPDEYEIGDKSLDAVVTLKGKA